MHTGLIVLAGLFGAAAGVLLVPRMAYRLSVRPGQDWRATCPGGHLLPGWTGPAYCGDCASAPGPAGGAGTGRRGGWYGPRTAALAVDTALVCALLAYTTGPRPELGVWLSLTPFAVVLCLTDFTVGRLPSVLTLPLAGACAALLGVAALFPGTAGSWPSALLGGTALGGVYYTLHLVSPSGMGLGCVKLAPTVGTALGWYGERTFLIGSFAGFALSAVYALGMMRAGRVSLRTSMEFGPFAVCGALIGVAVGGLTA
ncbi:prepilin peptidase [Streptomyces desertarenae]|uniref:Prepilin peptidase n=1 Tax=Streptomyces desertarenae TaxID=2666184 RepID=A0ABW4PF28_9ACTN